MSKVSLSALMLCCHLLSVAQTGIISTVVGNGMSGTSGDGGIATAAKLLGTANVVFDGNGNYYFIQTNNTVRTVSK